MVAAPPTSPDESEEEAAGPEAASHASHAFSTPEVACALVGTTAAMAAIGHCQYTWTLFVSPLETALGLSASQVQGAFSTFVTLQTASVLGLGLLLPLEWHHRAMQAGAVMLLASLLGLSIATTAFMLYCSAALMGMAVGFVYNFCMSLSLRVAPDYRGLAAGLTAGGYGSGTLLTIGPIERAIDAAGYASVLRWLAVGTSAVTLMSSITLRPFATQTSGSSASMNNRADSSEDIAQAASGRGAWGGRVLAKRELKLAEAVREPSFGVLYVMLVLVSTVGLVVTAQLAPIAKAFALSEASLVGALQADRVLNGLSRPAWGVLSDTMGRPQALGLALTLQACVLVLWSTALPNGRAFVLFSALSTFSWGEVYSLFPAIAADLYGTRYVSQTYGALYTGKAVASLIAGPLVSAAAAISGPEAWAGILQALSCASALDAFLALVVLPQLSEPRLLL